MKRYKLKRDLPTHKAGCIFALTDNALVSLNPEDRLCSIYHTPDLEAYPNILTDWFEEIPEEPKTVWDLKTYDIFYVIEDGRVADGIWNCSDYTRNRDAGDVFLTREEAEKELARRKAKQILLRDTKGFKPNWKEYDYGVAVFWDVVHNKLVYNWAEYNDGTIRFRTDEDAEASIAAHEKEWKIYLEVEDE